MKHYECRVTIGYLVDAITDTWRMENTSPPVYINAPTPGEARDVARKMFEEEGLYGAPDWTGVKEKDPVSYLRTFLPSIKSVTARSISMAELNVAIGATSLFDITEVGHD